MIKPTKLSILLLSYYLPPPVRGGSGVFARELFSRFPQGEVDALVGVCDQKVGVTVDGGMKVIRKPSLSWQWYRGRTIGHLVYSLIWLWHAFILCKNKEYDLIVCVEYFPAGLVAWGLNLFKNIPYVIFFHGEELYGLWGARNKLNKVIMSNAAGFIGNSLNTKKLLLDKGAQPEKIIVCTPCVDYYRFIPADDIDNLKNKLGFKDKKVILTVARLIPRKGHKLAITALRRIVANLDNAVFVIVGPDFGYREEICQHARDCGVEGNIILTGNVSDDDLLNYYQACDVFVMVSDSGPNDDDLEGFGITFLEANACGKPVIGGNTGGMPEAIEDGVSGFIVDSRNEEKLAAYLEYLLKNPDHATELGKNGRSRVVAKFDYEQRSAFLRLRLVSVVSDQVKSNSL